MGVEVMMTRLWWEKGEGGGRGGGGGGEGGGAGG